jgi:magnesium transporter
MNREELIFTIRNLLLSLDGQAFAHVVRTTPWIDVVEALEPHAPEAVAPLLQTLPPALQTELFAHFDEARQDTLLRLLPREAVVRLFETLPSDDRADLFNRLSDEARSQILPALAQVEREDILRLAAYPEGTVGSVTTSDYASVAQELTVEQALAALRAGAPDKETIYVVYVLDAERRLLGTVSLRELVLARPETRVAELMNRGPVFARAEWPRAQAAELIRRYDLLALPVINGSQRMIGIVTVDDAMDIEKESDATQLARFGGTATLGGPDLDVIASPFAQMFKVRVFWLAILTFFGVLTSTFVAQQEAMLSSVIVLAAFIAPIVDMGGNTGSQSATLVIRAMALGELKLRWRDVGFIIRRELPVALALGAAVAVLEVVLAYFAKGVAWEVLTVVGLAMLACTVLGGIIGALLPFMARRIGTDPATLSSPLITSVMDLLGVFIYFALAYAFLGHLIAPGG